MIRALSLFCLVLFAVAAGRPEVAYGNAQDRLTAPAGPVTLREHVVVQGGFITLGDLFNNVPDDKVDINIAYAPRPGKRAVFDMKWLHRVAQAYKLPWRPLSRNIRSIVERDSLHVPREEIEAAIMDELMVYDLPPNPRVELSNRSLNVHIPSEQLPMITVKDTTFDRRSGRFSVLLMIGDPDAPSTATMRLAGHVIEMIDLPTVSRRLIKGDVIRAEDITWVQVRADGLQKDAVVDVSQLIGKTPKRFLRPEAIIRLSEVRRPVLVERGDLATIILKKGSLTLTSQGKALEDGAEGDTIRISNTRSSKVIDAIVIGSNTVTVISNPRLALN